MALKLGELQAVIKADDTHFTKGLKTAEGKFRGFGDKMKTGAALVGAAIGVALAAGVAGAMELDKARAKLSAQIGDPALAAKLGKIAGAVYGRGFGESAAAAMDAVSAVASLVPDGDAAKIEDLTVKVQAYATAWGGDVADAAKYASTLIGSGLAKDATHAMDLITVASRRVPTALREDVLEAGEEYGQFFRALGFNGEQAFGALAAASAKGQYGIDKTGDAIKEFTLLSTDMSKASTDAYKAIGLDAGKMSSALLKGGDSAQVAFQKIVSGLLGIKDPTAQANTAIALFGTPLEDMNKADIPEFLAGLGNVGAGLGDVAGASKKAGDALEQSASQKLESFKNKAKSALIDKLGEAIPTIEKVAGWIERNSGFVGALATGLGALALVIGTILGIYKVWIILQTALNIVMMLNPIGLIVLAVIGLILVFVGLWQKFEGFRNFWKATWEIIKGAASAVGDWFVNTLWKKWILGAWNGITSAGGKALDWFKGLPGKLKSALLKVADFITAPFRAAFNGIAGLWNRTAGKLRFTVPPWVPGIGGNGFSLPQIPLLAKGGHIMRAGAAMVGDAGPEILNLPAGATVRPLSGGGSAPTGFGGQSISGELRVTGELIARGSDLVVVLRDRVAINGGNVQAVIGSNQ